MTLSTMEDKTNFSRRLKQFDGLTLLTLTPIFWQIYAIAVKQKEASTFTETGTSPQQEMNTSNIS